MIPVRYSLDWREGWLCVRYDSCFTDRPEVVSHWWPIVRRSKEELRHWPEPLGELLQSAGTDGFQGGRYYRLQDGGQTKPIASEVFSVPKPKGVRNVAWHYGRWKVTTKQDRYEIMPTFPALNPPAIEAI